MRFVVGNARAEIFLFLTLGNSSFGQSLPRSKVVTVIPFLLKSTIVNQKIFADGFFCGLVEKY